MAVARSSGFYIGSAVGTGVTLTASQTSTGSEVDMFGNDTTEGWIHLFLYYTSSTTAGGTITVNLFYSQVTGSEAEDQSAAVATIVPPASVSQKIYIGRFPCSRYMIGQLVLASVTSGLTNAVLGYELYAES